MASKNSSFPSVSANSMEIGDISIGEDGQQYIVAISVSGKNGKTKNVWKVYEPEEIIPEIVEEPKQESVKSVKSDKASKKKSEKGDKSSKDEDKKSESDKEQDIQIPHNLSSEKKDVKEKKKEKVEKETKKKEVTKKSEKVEVEVAAVVEKTKRLPNEYNRFISTKMAEYRETHPEITNGREKMKMAAAEWKAIKAV